MRRRWPVRVLCSGLAVVADSLAARAVSGPDRRGLRRPWVCAAAAATLLGSVGAPATAGASAAATGPGTPAPPPSAVRWLALGDSYSSGLGAGPLSPEKSAWGTDCGRARGTGPDGAAGATAYPVAAAGLLRARGVPVQQSFVACAGSTTDGWAHQVAEAYRSQGLDVPLPAQETTTPTRDSPTVRAIRAQASAGHRWDVVTTTAGGNNVRLARFATGCVDLAGDGGPATWGSEGWGGCDVGAEAARAQADLLSGTAPLTGAARLVEGRVPLWSSGPDDGDVDPYLDAVARLVRPGGRVLVLGYPRAFEDPDRSAVALGWPAGRGLLTRVGACEGAGPADTRTIRSVIDLLDAGIRTAVESADEVWRPRGVRIEFVDVAGTVFETAEGRHGLCSAAPWIQGFGAGPDGGALHPTQAGQDAMARAVAARLTPGAGG